LNGQEQNWNTLENALFWSTAKSGGSRTNGSFTFEEFIEWSGLIRSVIMLENWKSKLPNGNTLEYIREI
jgi:hypothetical protein